MKRTVYDADHESFRSAVRDFLAREVTPHYPQWRAEGRTPRSLFNALGAFGVLGFDIPAEYGGAGPTSFKYQAVLMEEWYRAGVEIGHYSVSTSIVTPYLLNLANAEQKSRWLPGVASGDLVLCIAMTEPGTGSDLAGIRTTARLSEDGEHYILNGAKTFISGALNSELCVVVARTESLDGSNRRGGLSLLVVETSSPGFAFGRKLDKIGQHSIDLNELSFTDLRVPVANLLGEEGRGFEYLSHNLPRERLTIACEAVGRAHMAIEHTRQYVLDRTVFGRQVGEFQNTKFVLAECAAELAAAQALTDQGLELDDAGELTAADAAQAKLIATETAGRIIDRCLQLHGGYGYITEYPIAQLYEDTRVNRIYGGTSEVMKMIIARDLGL